VLIKWLHGEKLLNRHSPSFQTASDLTKSQAVHQYPPLRSYKLLNLSTRRACEVSWTADHFIRRKRVRLSGPAEPVCRTTAVLDDSPVIQPKRQTKLSFVKPAVSPRDVLPTPTRHSHSGGGEPKIGKTYLQFLTQTVITSRVTSHTRLLYTWNRKTQVSSFITAFIYTE